MYICIYIYTYIYTYITAYTWIGAPGFHSEALPMDWGRPDSGDASPRTRAPQSMEGLLRGLGDPHGYLGATAEDFQAFGPTRHESKLAGDTPWLYTYISIYLYIYIYIYRYI
jgi:hypothetical protein